MELNLTLILLAALVASVSPGPATLTIAGTSMQLGRAHGLALASGVTTGSLIWSIGAALGLSAVMMAHGWMFEAMRYLGAGYLLYLGYKQARSALRKGAAKLAEVAPLSIGQAYRRGLLLHLTNPKAILFFGALYAVGVPQGAPVEMLALVILSVALQSLIVFHSLALIFASPPAMRGYLRFRRGFEAVFAVAFAGAGLKILTTRLG